MAALAGAIYLGFLNLGQSRLGATRRACMLVLSQSPNLLQFVRSQQSQRQAHLKTVEKGMQRLFLAIESIEHKQPAPITTKGKYCDLGQGARSWDCNVCRPRNQTSNLASKARKLKH